MNGKISNNYRIRPPKVVGVVKNTQMVSPFGSTSETNEISTWKSRDCF